MTVEVEQLGTSQRAAVCRLRLESMRKSFFGVPALAGVDLDIHRGEVHALLGGNGSGKSTLVKILAGVYNADGGRLVTPNQELDAIQHDPRTARHLGLRFVHQDLGLFPALSIAENLALDHQYPTRRPGRVAWRRLHEEAEHLCELVGLRVPVTAPVAALRPAQRTLVAMARALRDGDQDEVVLVLDEPTASLPDQQTALILDAAARRAANGQAVVMITHRLGEARAIAHRVTVLRDGVVSGTGLMTETSDRQILSMLGTNEPTRSNRTPQPQARTAAPVILAVNSMTSGAVCDASLVVHAGEIVGVAGLLGSGRSQLLRSIFGAQPSIGEVRVDGRRIRRTTRRPTFGVPEAIAAGLALVPEERAADAVFPDQSVRDNLMAAQLGRFRGHGIFRRDAERTHAAQIVTAFQVKAGSIEQPLLSLSGGNQQKVILARWMQSSPRVLLLDEPTQGVDVMSRAEIYTLIRAAATSGCAVLVVSSDTEELAALCERVLIMESGRVTDEVTRGDVTDSYISQRIHQVPAATNGDANDIAIPPPPEGNRS